MHIFVKIYVASNATGVFRLKPQGGGFFFVIVSLATNKQESVEVSMVKCLNSRVRSLISRAKSLLFTLEIRPKF